MAYQTDYKFKVAINIEHTIGKPVAQNSVSKIHVKLVWDDCGRRWWECVGWSDENLDVINDWDEQASELSTVLHLIVSSHMTSEIVEKIIAAYVPEQNNVIDFESCRKLRMSATVSPDQNSPAISRT